MTKLLQWLAVITLISGVWIAALKYSHALGKWQNSVYYVPIILMLFLALYIITIIVYRTFTFNTCEDAADELQKQIEQARKDLQSKGVILKKTGTSSTS